MPNWVYNSVTLTGDKDVIDTVKNKLNNPFVKKMMVVEDGEWKRKPVGFMNPVFSFWNIIKPDDVDWYYTDDNWYNWNITNWGTKWDVAKSDDSSNYNTIGIAHEEDGQVLYVFDTAWAPPIEALRRLSEQYPTIQIKLDYEEEQGWGGHIVIEASQVVVWNEYDSKY